MKNTDYQISDRQFNLTNVGNLSQFDDSFNFIIGTSDNTINLLDNPYISFNVYELTHKWEPKISTTIKLKKCTFDDMTKFISTNAIKFYPNALCFEDKSKVELKGNWFNEEYSNIYIAIETCN